MRIASISLGILTLVGCFWSNGDDTVEDTDVDSGTDTLTLEEEWGDFTDAVGSWEISWRNTQTAETCVERFDIQGVPGGIDEDELCSLCEVARRVDLVLAETDCEVEAGDLLGLSIAINYERGRLLIRDDDADWRAWVDGEVSPNHFEGSTPFNPERGDWETREIVVLDW